jgi:RNA polymerase sigma-70 factor (ECF subfamily)
MKIAREGTLARSERMPGQETPLTEDLLKHERFVRSLARRLVVDANDADDLVQQTWLKAIQYPPRHPDRLRGWLALVVRNVARNNFQANRRRADREKTAGPGSDVRSAPEIIEEHHAHKQLASALDNLRPEYREVLRMRFFDGLPPRRIAPLLDVPLNTVYTRLRRALVCMRSSMEVSVGRNRTAWGLVWPALFFGLFRRSGRVPAAKWATATIAPVVGSVGVALVVLLVTYAALADGRARTLVASAPRSEAPAAPAPRPVETPVAPVEVPRGADSSRTELPAPTLAPPAELGELAKLGALDVRTVWADTRRLAGHTALRLEHGDSAAVEGATTDAEGRASFDDLAPGTWTVRADGGAPALVRVDAAEKGELVLELPPGMDVRVVVTDTIGAPVANADVWLSWPGRPESGRVVGTTASGGRLSLEAVDPSCWIGVRHADYRQPRILYVGDLGRAEAGVLRFGLRDAPPLAGIVRDEAGQPVAGARIEPVPNEVFPPRARRHGTVSMLAPGELHFTDDEGRFELPAPSSGCELSVRAEGFASANAPLPRRATARMEITLARLADVTAAAATASRIHGIARDADGEPLRGWRVLLEQERHALGAHAVMVAATSHTGRRSTLTDREGRFSFEDCSADTHVLWLASPEARAVPLPYADARGIRPGADAVELTATSPSAHVHGMAPGLAPGAVVLASEALIAPLAAPIAETGHFAFAKLPAGEYTLGLWSAGLLQADVKRVQLTAGGTLDVGVLKPNERGSVYAQVRQADGRVPRRVVATLTRDDDPSLERFPTEMSPEGLLYFALLDPGAYTLRVEAPGMEPGTLELTVERGEEQHVALQLELAFP